MANQFSAIMQAIADSLSDTQYGLTRLSQSEAAMTIIVISAGCLLVYFAIKTVQHVLFLIRISTICIVLVLSVGIGFTLWFKLSISLMPSVYKTVVEPQTVEPTETIIMLTPPDPPAFVGNVEVQFQPLLPVKPVPSDKSSFRVSGSSTSSTLPKSKPEGKKVNPTQKPSNDQSSSARRHSNKSSASTHRDTVKESSPKPSAEMPAGPSKIERAIEYYKNFQTQRDLLYPLLNLVWSSKDDKQ